MNALLDSSILIAALAPDEDRHAECFALVLQGDHLIYAHALLETFSTLTGGKLGIRVDANLAARLLRETVLPRVQVIELGSVELLNALQQTLKLGVRGGGVYDFMHLVAAKKAGAEKLYTLNLTDFRHFHREGDPAICLP